MLFTCLEVVEARRRRDPEGGDDSDEEPETQPDELENEPPKIRLPISVLMARNKPKPELSNYDGSLSTKALLD